jgi:16S rRNA (cytidine1402-2'-O)-methyltransferase
MPPEVGALYVVATPIGNLEDITLRAVRVLGGVDRVLAEDTRRTGQLLKHLGHNKPLVSLHEHNERARIEQIVGWLAAGESLALVSDAGTPTVSDPGFPLVRAVADAGHRVVPIPGPSALTAAVSAAGLPTDRVLFIGFLPKRAGRRKAALREALEVRATTAMYVSPHKLPTVLSTLLELAGPERGACLCRELTKVHEEFDRAPLGELEARWRDKPVKGELTLLVEPPAEAKREKVNKYARQRDAEQGR